MNDSVRLLETRSRLHLGLCRNLADTANAWASGASSQAYDDPRIPWEEVLATLAELVLVAKQCRQDVEKLMSALEPAREEGSTE